MLLQIDILYEEVKVNIARLKRDGVLVDCKLIFCHVHDTRAKSLVMISQTCEKAEIR